MLQEKLIDLYCRLRSITVVTSLRQESSLRTMDRNKEKEISEAVLTAIPVDDACVKTLYIFCEITFNHILKMKFLCGYRIEKAYL